MIWSRRCRSTAGAHPPHVDHRKRPAQRRGSSKASKDDKPRPRRSSRNGFCSLPMISRSLARVPYEARLQRNTTAPQGTLGKLQANPQVTDPHSNKIQISGGFNPKPKRQGGGRSGKSYPKEHNVSPQAPRGGERSGAGAKETYRRRKNRRSTDRLTRSVSDPIRRVTPSLEP